MIDGSNHEEPDVPLTELEADRSSGSGRPPSKTAIGTSDGGHGPGEYRVGQKLKVLIIAPRIGGYEVLIIKDDITAFLNTANTYDQGAVLIAKFSYWRSVL